MSVLGKMFFSDSLVISLVATVISLFVILISYYKWSYQYWHKKNLPYIQPKIPFGNLANPIQSKESIGTTMFHVYKEMRRRKWKHGGIYFFSSPAYYAIDLDYIKNILTKDFQYFSDRGIYYNEKDDPISASLFAIGGTKWRNLRTKLTPTFTSGKMKMMFPTLIDCEAGLQTRIDKDVQKNQPIDIKEVLACFTTDVISTCAFGLDCQTFQNENSPFREYGKKLITPSKIEVMKRLLGLNFPNFARALRIKVTPPDAEDFFMKLVKNTVDYREKNDYFRKDFMQLLIGLKNKLQDEESYLHDGKTLTIEEVVAQSVIFFVAGFETSSTTMAFALYELARNPEIQQRVRDEINTTLSKYDGKITYDAIHELQYMDLVIKETLRKYAPVPMLTRECVKDYKIPDEDIIIEKGTTIIIPIQGVHYDPEYYPDPEKFDPERFTEENKNTRHHYTYMPFGEGPRICIGMRFGLMQSKVGLTSLLRRYEFTVSNKTKEPLKMKPVSFILAVEGEIWLNATKI